MKLTKTQAAIILGGVYIFLQTTADIAATKVIVLGKKAARTAIILAGIINVIMALYFIFVIKLPAQGEWAAAGGQKAWEFIFGIVPRIVIASIIAEVISEL